MAGDNIPTVQSLEKPEKLEDILRQDRGDDCLSCKVVGSGAFFGLGAYSYFSGMSQLEKQKDLILRSKSPFGMRSRKLGITSISLALVWMGLWRALK
ncbi:exosome complex [Fusarium sporotrichioides]|uniref:Exosome complex n=1 Tax=Fusarium sporotrichioides TaxID=5514 RepID=A0A395SPK6_FUSSP|nr:exosome complex [Fusarium sporotrichioides]